MLNDLSLKNQFQSEQFLEKSKQIKNKNSVAIHVRRGDYISNPIVNQQFGICSAEYYENAIRDILLKVEMPEFFVFSDDISWCKDNLNVKDINIQYITGFKDYEDLILISQCKHQIISNSTFGWWGAWLNQNPFKIVIAPKIWYIDPTLDTSMLIPTEWIRL